MSSGEPPAKVRANNSDDDDDNSDAENADFMEPNLPLRAGVPVIVEGAGGYGKPALVSDHGPGCVQIKYLETPLDSTSFSCGMKATGPTEEFRLAPCGRWSNTKKHYLSLFRV